MNTATHENTSLGIEDTQDAFHNVINQDDRAVSLESTPSSSPPDSRPATPQRGVTIQPCPARLRDRTPPKNFGAVMDYTIFRSGFPEEPKEIEFMECLGLNSIITLVTKKESCEAYNDFVTTYGIQRKIMAVEPNKEEVRTDDATLCEAILFIMNPRNHPVYIHCNQGRHRTGCMVACLRKIQQWPIEDIIEEYNTYATPKPRKGDLELIRTFDPSIVFKYAKQNDMLKDFETVYGIAESFTDIYQLAASCLIELPSSVVSSSNSSEMTDDEPLTIAFPTPLVGVAPQDASQYPLPLSPPTDDKSSSDTMSDVSSVDLNGDVSMAGVAY